MAKIEIARAAGQCPSTGMPPGFAANALQAYIDAGISTDHECYDFDEAREKLERGMKMLIREGSAARNFDTLADLMDRLSGWLHAVQRRQGAGRSPDGPYRPAGQARPGPRPGPDDHPALRVPEPSGALRASRGPAPAGRPRRLHRGGRPARDARPRDLHRRSAGGARRQMLDRVRAAPILPTCFVQARSAVRTSRCRPRPAGCST